MKNYFFRAEFFPKNKKLFFQGRILPPKKIYFFKEEFFPKNKKLFF